MDTGLLVRRKGGKKRRNGRRDHAEDWLNLSSSLLAGGVWLEVERCRGGSGEFHTQCFTAVSNSLTETI